MKTNLHKTYYLLAIIDVITIIITLFLAYSIYQTYEESFRVNDQWVQRSIKYDRLTDLAIEANGPGNDVFDSRDVKKESHNLRTLNTKIDRLKQNLTQDASENLHSYPIIKTRINNFSQYLQQANHLTYKIFDLIKENKLNEAGHIMAQMDSKFHAALLEISLLRNKVRSIQKEQLSLYHQQAKKIFYKKLYIAGFILFLVALIVYFGRKIKESFDAMLIELALKNDTLSDSEKKLQSVLNTILESVILIDDKGNIEYMNPMAEGIFQYKLSEIKGKNVKMLMPQPYRSEHDSYISNYITTRKAKVIGSSREVQGLKKDGSVFPLELGVSEVCLKERVMFAGVLKDITERKQSDFYLSSIAKIQDMYINGSTQNEIFDTILQFLLDYTGSEYGFIGAIFNDDQQLPYLKTFAITNVAWNEETRKFYDENAPQGLEFRNLNTLFGHTIKTGEIVISNDPSTDPRSGGIPKGHPAMDCYLGMPIQGNDGLIAMYGIANRRGGYTKALAKELNAITAVMTSIIESARSLSLIEKMANRDALTGAYNRFYFKSYVNELLRQRLKKKNPRKFSIMMIDFNKFKHINDFHGHEYGDYIIKEFVHRVEESMKTEDILARIGGDEFVVLVDDIRQFSDAGKIAKRVVGVSSIPYIYKGKKMECSASIGIACFPDSGHNIDTLLRHADLALYRAKQSGDGYCYFSDELQEQYMNQKCLERDIIEAFDNREFYFLLQPIVDIETHSVLGAEALIRWQHPTQGDIIPNDFISVIEAMGLSDRLNLYVIEEIISIFREQAPYDVCSVSLNISPYCHDLNDNMHKIVERLDASPLHTNIKLYFEITETSFMSKEVNLHKGSELDSLLERHNIGLSIDDFGIEYSSINRLFDCNFSKIKIDMSFIQKLDTKESHAAEVVIKAILDIAHGLGVEVISEGVETESQLLELKKLGGKVAQGYYFYKPMPVKEFLQLI